MQLRKDYVLNKWVIIASTRNDRPKQFESAPIKSAGTDFFAPGNEHMTPEEIGRVPKGDGWKIRWFANKFPFLDHNSNGAVETHNEFYTFAPAFGYHEVIVETPGNEQIWDLSSSDLSELFGIYKHRIEELSKQDYVKYVLVFKNHGKEAGCSLVHSHTQVAALSHLPDSLLEEAQVYNKSVYDSLIAKEKDSERRCFENEHFIAICPYASRFQYEVLVLPKEHLKTMDEFDPAHLDSLGEIMEKILLKLKSVNAPFNYYLHYGTLDNDLRFHIEICPRLATWAGFENGSGIIVNAVSPESAAAFYRD